MAAGAAGVAIFSKLAKRFFPLPKGYESEGPSLEELAPRYRRWDYIGLALTFLVVTGMTYVWSKLLIPLYEWHLTRFEPALFALHAPCVAMFVPAFFLGIISCYPISQLLCRLLLQSRFESYIRYDNLKQGYDTRRAGLPVFIVFLLFSVALLLGIINWHAEFGQNEVSFTSWFGISRSRYHYSAVKDIRTSAQFRALNGNLVSSLRNDGKTSSAVLPSICR